MKLKYCHSRWIWSAILVAACSACTPTPEDRVYEAFKCGKAAALLEQEDDAAKAGTKVEAELATLKASGKPLPVYIAELNARFEKEFPAKEQMQKLHDSQACQAIYASGLLDLGDASPAKPPAQNADRATAPAMGAESAESTSEQAQNTAALMNVAKLLATQNGGDPVAVAQFCEQNARGFASVDELQQCKALGGPAALAGVPKSAEEAFQVAATLPAQARFDFCTSGAVTRLYGVYSEDYDRCFPDDAKQEAERLGGLDMGEGAVRVTPEAIQDRIVTNSAQMNARERKAYCFTQEVLDAFENDPSQCLNGEIIPDDTDPGYRDEGH